MLNLGCSVKYVAYVRVSTELKSQKDSLENQISFFVNYIQQKNGELVQIYADHGKTGTSLVKREEMKKLLKDAKRGLYQVVLIKSITRWARDTVDSLLLVRELKSCGVQVVSIEDNYDSFKDQGEMHLTMLSMLAQQESDNISRNVSFGIREKARNGMFHGTPPYGYKKENGKLIPKYPEADVVKEIFHLYLKEGWGRQKIANHLTSSGVSIPRSTSGAKNAGDIWHDSTLKTILTNPHYTGDLVQGRTKTNPDDKAFSQQKGYKRRKEMDDRELIIVPKTHIPLVNEKDFVEVQKRMKQKATKIFRGRGKKSLFARLAFCADCGAGMNYKNDRKEYVCGTYQKNGRKSCSSHAIKHTVLKEQVLTDLKELATHSLNIDSLLRIAQTHSKDTVKDLKSELKNLQNSLKQLENDQMELVRLLTRKTINEDMFKRQNEVTENEIQILKQKQKELEAIMFQEKDAETSIDKFQKEIQSFIQLKMDDEELLRQALHNLIDKIELSEDGSMTIHYTFNNPLLMGA